MKLGKRLKSIKAMVMPNYDHIWDCCCDHGLLGASLLTAEAPYQVHFADIVPELIQEVETKLQTYFNEAQFNWQTHCLDVCHLPIHHYPGRHLIIIAGIGGDLMIKIVEDIQQRYSHLELDFLLCPVYQVYELRQSLLQQNLSLIDEQLIEDNKRFYEIILVSNHAPEQQSISPTGQFIWQTQSIAQKQCATRYLHKLCQHYQRQLKSTSDSKSAPLNAYQQVQITLNHQA